MAAFEPLALRAGPLHTTLHEGRLGPVFVDGHEVWHGVHFLLRDPHWRTPVLRLEAPRHQARAGGWSVVVDGCFDVEPAVPLRLTLDGGDDGTLCITGEAWPAADIDVNRLGLCLLHPLDRAGADLEVTHDDGRLTRSSFPTLIPPWPPFTAIRALRHAVAPGCTAAAEFDGDSFEFEDQRNNADASFKTYSRSNFMPRPYRLRAGEVVRQRLTLRVQGRAPAPAVRAEATVIAVPLPDASSIGVELTPDDLADAGTAAACAAGLRPDHLHLVLSACRPLPDLQALADVLAAGGSALRLDVTDVAPGTAVRTLQGLADALRAVAVAPAALAVFPSTPEAVRAARTAFPACRLGGGTPDFFVQLNRAEGLPALDFLAFTVCPIVHAADDATLIEGRRSLAGMLQTLQHRHPATPVHLGPSRIAARRSPLGELAPSDGTRAVPLAGRDPRERTAFGAAWAAAHIAAALQAGAAAVTVANLTLCRGPSPLGDLLATAGHRRRAGGLLALCAGSGEAPHGLRIAAAEGWREWVLPPQRSR